MSAKPATPLPWHESEAYSDEYAHKRGDIVYLVHAANAYHRLVAALRDAYSAVQPEMRVESRIKLAKIGDLLRELGELE